MAVDIVLCVSVLILYHFFFKECGIITEVISILKEMAQAGGRLETRIAELERKVHKDND